MNQRYFLDLGVSISRILQETRAHIIYLSGYYYTSYCYGYGERAGNRVGETYRDDLKSLQYKEKQQIRGKFTEPLQKSFGASIRERSNFGKMWMAGIEKEHQDGRTRRGRPSQGGKMQRIVGVSEKINQTRKQVESQGDWRKSREKTELSLKAKNEFGLE